MFQIFYPSTRAVSAYKIDYESYYKKGYRGLIFDIDNTLVKHGEAADEAAVALFQRLHTLGFQTCLISNNKEKRVVPFAKKVDSLYIYDAHKPSIKNYLKAVEAMGIKKEQAIFVGDQIFTDAWGAKRAGIYNILVSPINPKEEIQIVLKRYLERIVLWEYEKKRNN